MHSSISIVLSSSPKPVFIGLSSHITHHYTATCDVRRWTNALFIEYPVYRSHSTHNVILCRIQNLNGFSIEIFCSLSVHNVMLRCIQNLNGFSIGFFCSLSAYNMTLCRIQNLNSFSIGFFCSYSAHNMTLRHIHRLPTNVGLAQARPY